MFSLTTYFSVTYLWLFLPAAVGLYALLPQRGRRWVLLGFSYLFFWAVSGKLLVFLLLSTVCIHYAGLWLAQEQADGARRLEQAPREARRAIRGDLTRRQRGIVAAAVLLQIGILIALKYSPFFAVNLNTLLRLMGAPVSVPVPRLALPIGISFYTLQAVSYLFDVYRSKIPADRNLGRLALYLAFFPQLMEGPICRYQETACGLWDAPALQSRNLRIGLYRILFGVMKKMVVADRLNLLIRNVFDRYDQYQGWVIALGAVCYTIQLYMDFSGTMDLAIGTGQIFGVCLPENFKQPFCSKSIAEFWQRWHITLGRWFRDYVFYPVSMSGPLKKLTVRARGRLGNYFGPLLSGSIALFCVWVLNGLWHGAAWSYLFFGMYHFGLMLLGNLTEPLSARLTDALHISRTSRLYRSGQIVRTGLLVCIGELFFRANGLQAGLAMFGRMVSGFSADFFLDRQFLVIGLDVQDWLIVAVMLVLVTWIGHLQERGVAVWARLADGHTAVRFAAGYAMIMAIVVFGAYGAGYVPVDPIYAGF